MTVRTRFAPSPTGLLHIGNARAALFNFLFSRHHGGQFLLRIEDTDRERSTQRAVDVIFAGLAWMGIEPDEAPVFQSTREERHAAVARALLERGHAYKCFCSADELKQMRERAVAEGRPPRYDGMWRDRDPSEAPPGAPYTIRLRAPRDGETVVDDLVQGTVTVANAEMDDMIILRADGTPTYLHAVVVDDHDMAITHVIRGDDHLTNTFRQSQIYALMGWERPRFAHLPLIHGPDGAKLSKRHGAQSVVEFRDQGFLPEALNNYLLRLGWGHGDVEIIDRAEQIRLFDLDGVGRSPSRMDYTKLSHLNGVYLRQAEDSRLAADVAERLSARPDLLVDDAVHTRIRTLMPALKERARTLVELADNAAFLCRAVPLPMDDKAAALLTADNRELLRAVAHALAPLEPFDAPAVDAALRSLAESEGRKLGQLAQPLRAALTGSTSSPPIDHTVAALGRDECMARIGSAIGTASGGTASGV
ncbi:MAG: glutamate--tRNA ligase [Gluconacetobacter diazotrophicus]|nr:glutamate--tRNA ligase [Gluconacetobacter diazotrophicus]